MKPPVMPLLLLAGVLAFAGPGGQSQAQTTAPAAAPGQPSDTPASMLGRRMLQAATEGDDAYLAFMHKFNPNTKRTDEQFRSSRPQIAAMQFHGVEQASATHAELSVFDTTLEVWARMVVDVTPTDPPTIAGLSIRPGKRPADVASPPRLTAPALAAATRDHLAAAEREDQFSGAVLVSQAGKTILEQAYGLADRTAKTPNTADTQFRFGSMGKMFTAVSIMQLAQAGRLDLTAPIGTYLKDYPNPDIASHVTVNNLLTHTGGTGDIFTPEFDAHRLELKDARDYVAIFGSRAPKFAPGTQTEYSNYGFMLLGRIVELVSGQSYDAYIARHIFAPAHMTSTGNEPETTRLPRRATGYMTQGSQLVSADDTLPWRGTPAGGGYSTVSDLARFADALMSDRLLDAAHTKLLTTGGITGPRGELQRYDFGAPAGDGRRFFGHGGGAPGMNGELRIFPAEAGHESYTVVVLANRDPPAATRIANFVAERLP